MKPHVLAQRETPGDQEGRRRDACRRSCLGLVLVASILASSSLSGADLLYQPTQSSALDAAPPPVRVQRPPAMDIKGPAVRPGQAAGEVWRRPAIPPLASFSPGGATDVTPEIQELARGLRGDPKLIYELVRNTIEYVPMYGSVKGATMTFVDGRGNDFDQASLFIALMRASGFTASYIYGQIQLSGAQVESWLGLPDDANVVANVLWNGGIPSDVWMNGSGGVSYVQLDHVWAKATIGGTEYVFDPSFKGHALVTGIDLAGAMGYDQATFLARATAGMTSDPNYVKNVNRANIRADITSYATNLADYITTTDSGMTLAQVIGGQSIVAVRGAAYQTALPYEIARTYTWTDIPDAYQTTLRIRHIGIDVTLKTVDFYGKRLTIAYSGGSPTYIPVLVLDGAQIAFGNPTSAFFNACELTVDHPYAGGGGSYGDDDASVYPGAGGIYYISTSWGGTGRQAIEKRRRVLDGYMAQGLGDTSEPVMGETLAMIGLSWMAETTRASELGDRIDATSTILHHELGIVGQMPGQSVFMDMPMSMSTVVSTTGESARSLSRQYVRSGVNSGFEWAAIDQMQPNSAVSTIKLLDQASAQGYKIFDATSANWTAGAGIRSQLVGYGSGALSSIDAYISAGYRVILPERGDLQDDQYHGVGYILIGPGGTSIANMIYGSLYGGNGNHIGIVNASDASKSMKKLDESKNNSKSSDPIDLVTGSATLDSVNLSVGLGPFPFALGFESRYVSSSYLIDGPLGLGWDHNWDLAAGVGSDGFRAMGDSTPRDSATAIAELYVASDMLRAGLAKERIGIATLAHRFLMDSLIDNVVNVAVPGDSFQFVKTPGGTYGPPPGLAVALSRGGDGSFTLRDTNGDNLAFGSDGRLLTWTNTNGITVSLTYTADGLSSVGNGLGRALTLAYLNGRVASLSDGNGRVVAFTYDSSGHLTGVTDPNGHTTAFAYDASGRLQKVFKPSRPTEPFVTNTYDELGRVSSQVDASGQTSTFYYAGNRSEDVDPLGHSEVRYFDERGHTVARIDRSGHQADFTFDGQGRAVAVTMPEGNRVEYAYDQNHNPTQVTVRPKPPSSLPAITTSATFDVNFNAMTSSTDPLGHVTTFTYDTKGNLVSIDQPAVDGVVPQSSFTRNARGQIQTTTDQEGMVNRFTYDPTTADLLTTTVDYGRLGLTTAQSYDAAGNLTHATDELGRVRVFAYDADRQLTQHVAPPPFAFVTKYTYDADGNRVKLEAQTSESGNPWQVTTRTYSPTGQVLSVTDPQAHTTTVVYDALDRAWKITDAEGRLSQNLYDSSSRIYRHVDPLGHVVAEYGYSPNGKVTTFQDANGNITTYGYDEFDRLNRITYPNGSYEGFSFDAAGNLLSHRTRSGQSITFTYDALNRRVSRLLPDGSSTQYAYNQRGQLLVASDGAAAVAYDYDTAGRLRAVTSAGQTVQYQLDAASNRTRLTYPDGFYVTYSYDALNRLSEVRDTANTLIGHFDYDALSRRTNLTLGNGTSAAYAWESDDDLASLTHSFVGGSLELDYAYNAAHQLSTMTVSDSALLAIPTVSSSTTYTVSSLNQLASINGVAVTSDANGNLSGDGTSTYVYDAENRMTAATRSPHAATYVFDPVDRRGSATVDGVSTTRIYDGARILMEVGAAGQVLRRYVYGPGLDEPLRVSTPAGSYFVHADRLGSVIALSDAAGHPVETYAYSPDGEPSRTSAVGNRILFAGRPYDEETRLVDLRTRALDPHNRRFLQPDSVGFEGGLNLYEYGNGDPVNRVDPFGTCSCDTSEWNEDVEFEYLWNGPVGKAIENAVAQNGRKVARHLLGPGQIASGTLMFYGGVKLIGRGLESKVQAGPMIFMGMWMMVTSAISVEGGTVNTINAFTGDKAVSSTLVDQLQTAEGMPPEAEQVGNFLQITGGLVTGGLPGTAFEVVVTGIDATDKGFGAYDYLVEQEKKKKECPPKK